MVSKTKLDSVEENFSQIKEKLREYLIGRGIDASENRKFLCINPEHDDKSPSMSIFTHDHGFPIARCNSCGFIADIFTASHILEEKPIIGPGFLQDNVKYLADKFGIEVKIGALTEEEIYEINTFEAYKAASQFITDSKYSPKCLKEIENRKWSEDFAREYQVSCCVDYHEMRQHLKNIGFSARFLDEVDLDNQKIFNQDNLIFTIADEWGRPVGFSARYLDYDPEKEHNKSPKFMNTKTTGLRCNIFRKSERLYLIHIAKKFTSSSAPLYLVEGYGDALTLHANGVKNAAAVACADLNDKQLNLCRKLGINDIVICLDGDATGQSKAQKILDDVLKNVHDLRIRFVFLPWDGTNKVDPDQFVRDHGIDTFMALPKVEPFSWRLQLFVEDIEAKNGKITDGDSQFICQTMIPIISNEPSPLKRETMIRELSNWTGYSFQVIKEELDKIFSAEQATISRKKKGIIDNLVASLGTKSDGYEIAIEKAMSDLELVNKESQSDKFETESLVSVLNTIKTYQEDEDSHKAVNFGPGFKTLPIALAGDMTQKLILLGGSPNAGKTSLFASIAYNLAHLNEDSCCIVLTIDDGNKEFYTRMVTSIIAQKLLAERHTDLFDVLTINKIGQPFRWKSSPEYGELMSEREQAFRIVSQLVKDDKLAVFDSSYGKSLSLIRSSIKRLKAKHPNRKIYFFLDNFHLMDSASDAEGRFKYEELSRGLKDIIVMNDITGFSTVEYTKILPGQKPSNNNLAETRALEYDGNVVMHLYNELHDIRDKSKLYFTDSDGAKFPVVEHYFGKNKISSFKSNIFYKFYADKAYFEEVNEDEVKEIRDMNNNDGLFLTPDVKTNVSIKRRENG